MGAELTIMGRLEAVSPIHIGMPQERAKWSSAGQPVLLMYDAGIDSPIPVIPGSSLKGVVRTVLERILRTCGVRFCDWDDRGKVQLSDGCKGNNGEPCPICSLFGSMERSGSTRFHDARGDITSGGEWMVKDRPHFGGPGKGRFFDSEHIEPLDYGIRIDIDTGMLPATDPYLGLIILALDEFTHGRIRIGGNVSRGMGVVKFIGTKISSNDGAVQVLKEKIIPPELDEARRKAREWLTRNTSNDSSSKSSLFKVYDHARDDHAQGCITVILNLTAQNDFFMRGIDEDQVRSSDGRAVLPGSTLKGFVRKALKGRPEIDIDDIFGDMKTHRSKFFISDAYHDKERVRKGDVLTTWLLLDNMNEREVRKVMLVFFGGPKRVTGKTAARGGSPRGDEIYNKFTFEVSKAWKFHVSEPRFDITRQMKEMIR